MSVIARRKIFYSISGFLLAGSSAVLLVFGLEPGIDFAGGSLLEYEFSGERPAVEALSARIEPLSLGEVRLQPAGERGVIVRTRHLSEAEHQFLLTAIRGDDGGVEKRFDTIGPAIGEELRRRSVIAVVLVILSIVGYIALAFRKVSQPMASWKYGVVTIVALIHDVIIPAGFFAFFGRFIGFEADTLFITALLTILGFSVHDTIVVFDRIRENLKSAPKSASFADIVDASVSQTITRSINTSVTVLLSLIAVYLFGGESTRILALTLIIGIIAGTYSSICIASPLLVSWHRWQERRARLRGTSFSQLPSA